MSANMDFCSSAEVAKALAAGGPVVALESTIITHGMPYPQNLETALEVEAVVRAAGAVPATIAVLDGKLHVGLERAQLEILAQAKDVMKLSRADFGFAMAAGATGSTTVAATMIGAARAGIKVFATGGIGGVHRGADTSFDISADLTELARTPVVVVSAGVKAILDIPKTLEVLETQGVTVITYGQSDFPAFWSRSSGLPSPLSSDDLDQIARAYVMRGALLQGPTTGGMLLANPIPVEHEIAADLLAPVIAQATQEADEAGIAAKAVTPFLLQRIFELTQGRSLVANVELVKNNANLAAKLATRLMQPDGLV